MKIGFDFDGVIANSSSAKVKLAKKFGVCILRKQTPSVILKNLIRKSNYQRIAYLLYREETLKFSLCRGVKRIVKQLKKHGHTLYIVSARGSEERLFARIWLKRKNLEKFFDKIIFCSKPQKAILIKKHKIDVYIDDSPEILSMCPENTTKILYNPYYADFRSLSKKYVVIENFSELKQCKNTTNNK